MTNLHYNFAHRNLRNRSFRRQALQGSDFRQADLRGCDFREAQLQGSDFTGARIGMAPEPLLIGSLIVGTVGILSFQAVSHMIFGVMGRAPGDPLYRFTVALLACLAGIGGMSSVIPSQHHPRRHRISFILLGALCGAVLGFYYGGTLIDTSLRVAVISACSSAVVSGILGYFSRSVWVQTGILASAAPLTYGCAFLSWTQGVTALTGSLVGGILGLGLALLYVGLTLKVLNRIRQTIHTRATTSFAGANTEDVTFASH